MRGGGAGVESGRTQPRPLAGRQHLHRTRSVKHLLRGIPVLATRVAPAVVGVPVLTAAPAAARPTPRRPCRRATRRAVALATASAPHGSAGLACGGGRRRVRPEAAARSPCMPRTVLRSLRLASPKVALDGELDRRAQRCSPSVAAAPGKATAVPSLAIACSAAASPPRCPRSARSRICGETPRV